MVSAVRRKRGVFLLLITIQKNIVEWGETFHILLYFKNEKKMQSKKEYTPSIGGVFDSAKNSTTVGGYRGF